MRELNIDKKYLRRMTGLNVEVVPAAANTFDELGDRDAIIALKQSHGAGRGEHTFFSPLGGLYIVTRETGLNIDAHTLTPSVGLAAHDAIKSVLGIDTSLKWVNDVLISGKKAAGILVRSPRRGEYLIGIGINYATDPQHFISHGLSNAASLCAPPEKATDFCINLLKRIHLAAISPFDAERYNSLCATIQKTVEFSRGGQTVRGYAEYVDNNGSLIVRLGMATVALDSGEVSIIREAN